MILLYHRRPLKTLFIEKITVPHDKPQTQK